MKVEGRYWHQDLDQYEVLVSEFTHRTIFRNNHPDKFLISTIFIPFNEEQVTALVNEFAKPKRASNKAMRTFAFRVLSSSSLDKFCSAFDELLGYAFSHTNRLHTIFNLLIILHREGIIGFPLNRKKWIKDMALTMSNFENIIARDLVNKAGRDNIIKSVNASKGRCNSYSNIIYTPVLALCGVASVTDLSANIINHDYIMTTAEGITKSKTGLVSTRGTLNRLYEYLVRNINHDFPTVDLTVSAYNPLYHDPATIDTIDLYIGDMQITYPLMGEWIEHGRLWLKETKKTKSSVKSALKSFISQLNYYPEYGNPKYYFLSTNKDRPITKTNPRNLVVIQQFLNYVYEKTCVQEDPNYGKIWEHGYVRVDLGPQKLFNNSTTVKEKIPQKILDLMHEVITGNDFEWPKTCSEDWFDWINPETGREVKTWYPGRALAILLMYHLPLRIHQIVTLTSGIGDSFQLKLRKDDPENWAFWTDTGLRGKNGEIIQRGVSQRYEVSPGNYIPIFYISTNKTKDQNRKTTDKGYRINYSNKEAFQIICDFIDWADKYVQSKPTIPYNAINYYRHNYSKHELELMGEEHFLWLDPCRGGVLQKSNLVWFWDKLMQEVENRWNANAEPNDRFQIVFKSNIQKRVNADISIEHTDFGNDQDRLPRKAEKRLRWTPHCMRVTGITWMIAHGVSIDVIRAIAGHTNKYMTMYYMVQDPLEVEEKIKVAQELAKANASDECITYIKANFDKPENLLSRVFANSLERLMKINETSLLIEVSTGMCMTGCNGCDIGYEVQVESGNSIKTEYQPVPGGKESCELCLFYFSYPSFLEKLKVRWNYLAWIGRENYKELIEFNEKIRQLSVEKEQARKNGEIFRKNNLIDAYQRKADSADEKTKISLLLLQKVTLGIQKFQGRTNELANSSEEGFLLGNPKGFKMVAEMCHPFVALNNIVADSICEPFVNPTNELPYFKLAQMLDELLKKSELPPFVYQSHGPSREKQLIDHCARLRNLVPPDYYDELFNPDNFAVTLRTIGLVDRPTNTLVSTPIQTLVGHEGKVLNANIMEWDLQSSREMKEILDSVIAEEEEGEDEDDE